MTSLGDDSEAPLVGGVQKRSKILELAVMRMDTCVVGDIVAVVLERRRVERQKPDRRHAEVLKVAQLLGQPAKIANSIADAVEKGADVNFIDDRVFIPIGDFKEHGVGTRFFYVQRALPRDNALLEASLS